MSEGDDDKDRELAEARAEIKELRVYRTVMENAWAAHWVVDKDAVVKFASHTQQAMGLHRFASIGSATIYEMLPEDLRPTARAAVDEALEKPNVPVFVELRGNTGLGVWAEREIVAINRLDQPDVRGIVITSTDIGPRNVARQALRSAYERHALAAEVTNDLVWEWNVDDDLGSSTFVSAHKDPALQGSQEALQHVHPHDRERVRAALMALATPSQPPDPRRMDLEWRLVRTGEGPQWRRSMATVFVDERGRRRVIGRTSDIHERKLAEIALADSERLYRGLFTFTAAAVTMRDVETLALIDCNDAALKLYDVSSRDDFAKVGVAQLAPELQPDGRPTKELVEAVLEQARCHGSARAEWTARRVTGEDFIAQFHVSTIQRGERSAYQSIVMDVTEQRRSVEAMARAKEDALAGMRAKSAFLAAMSHELRSPVSGVIGMIDLLASGPLDARQKRYAELARASAHGLLSVINDVLDFSKFDAGGLEIASEELSLQDVIDDAVGVFATRASEKGLLLACRADEVPRVIGDAGRLRQVLTNLLGNAIKFTSRGEVGINLTVAEREQDAIVVRVQVSDTGIGIAEADAERVFVPFASLESAAQRGAGTGLGLAISRELTQRMGGRLSLESELGVGSRFTVTLRMLLARGEQPVRQAPTERHVLVVAGDVRQRSVLASALAARGYSAEPADSVDRVAERLRAGRHAMVVIVDDPPQFDGRAMAKVAAGAASQGVRVIFLESLRRPMEAEEASRLLITARCPSPFWNAKLDAAIRGIRGTHAPNEEHVHTSGDGACVLVVDDSAVNAEIAARVLGKAGYRVDLAETGEEAIELLTRRSYDAVLLDCRLPGIDGYETARRIRALEHDGRLLGARSLSIIALTASSASGDLALAIEAGMNAHVSKPFDASHLLRVLGERLRDTGRVAGTNGAERSKPEPVVARLDLSRALGRLGGDSGALERALQRFVELAPETFQLLSDAVLRRDRKAVDYAAHRLRGQALTFDANALVESAAALERAAASEDWPDVQEQLERTNQELTAVLRELSQR